MNRIPANGGLFSAKACAAPDDGAAFRGREKEIRFPQNRKKGASLMTISGTLTTTLTKPAELQRTYQPPQTATTQTQKPALTRRFDSVTISGENSRVFAAQTRARLANEIRSADASASVAALREEIRAGAYQTDSMEIARKMLLFGEDN